MMTTLDLKARTVEQTPIPADRIYRGPQLKTDDWTDFLHEGHEVGVIIAKDDRDDDYSVELLVSDPDENLPDAVTETGKHLRSDHPDFTDKVEVIAARATLHAEFGETAAEDTLTFGDVDVLQHEFDLPEL